MPEIIIGLVNIAIASWNLSLYRDFGNPLNKYASIFGFLVGAVFVMLGLTV